MDSEVRHERRAGANRQMLWLVGAVTLIALGLRFWKLGAWGLDSDEVFTLRDSLRLRPRNPRPLGYLLNHYLVQPFHSLDEFGLRVLPALFGVLAIPAFYFVARRLVGSRAAILGALLLTFSPLHVIYSQFGRYWSLVFLLTSIYPYAIYIGFREHNRRALILGIVVGILATLAHPVAVLLVGGPALWFAFNYFRPQHLRVLWQQKVFRWGVAVGAVLAVLIIIRFVPILQGWITEHDKNPGSGQFLLRPSPPPGLKQLVYWLTYVEGWTIPLVLTGMVGVALLWQGRDPFLGRFLTSLALFPAIFLPLVSFRTPISTYYLMPIAPVFFIGAGVFLDRLFQVDWRVRPRWLIPATAVVLVLVGGMPTLVSQYRNGRRFDFRGVAQWLKPRLTSGDIIYSDQPVALAYYLPDANVQRLRSNAAPLAQSARLLKQQDQKAALWVVAPAPSHAFRTNLRPGGLAHWMYQNCQMRNNVGVGRVDFRQQYLQVYRCPPELPAPSLQPAPASSENQRESVGASTRPLRDRTSR
jgi:mannosyltransferase